MIASSLLMAMVWVGGVISSLVVDVEISAKPEVAEVGEVVEITVTVSGEASADADLMGVPSMEGGKLTLRGGPSTRRFTEIRNGAMTRSLTTSWILDLVPERPGQLVLPPFSLMIRGETVEVGGPTLTIRPSTTSADAIGLLLRPSVQEVWSGQLFEVEITASLSEETVQSLVGNTLYLDLPWLDDDGHALFLDADVSTGDVVEIPINGGSRRLAMVQSTVRTPAGARVRLRSQARFVATGAGTLDLSGSSFSARIATDVQTRRGFFGERSVVATRSKVVSARNDGTPITIRQPPAADRPDFYTNAVGRFLLASSATPRVLRVGDTCHVTLTLTGQGNLAFVEWPKFPQLGERFRIFDKSEEKKLGERTLVIEVSPRNVDVAEVPPLELFYFNPESGTYESTVTEPMALDVSPGGDGALVTLEVESEVLRDLETIIEEFPKRRSAGIAAWVYWAPGLVALLLVETRRRRQIWAKENPRQVARRRARQELERALAEVPDLASVAGAFGHYLSARFGGPPAGLSAEAASMRLEDRDLAAELKRTVSGWEVAYLAHGDMPVEDAAKEARLLADRLEEQL